MPIITRRRLLATLTGAAAAIGVPSIWMSLMKTYDGPVSDHFDGLHFFDPDGAPPKSLGFSATSRASTTSGPTFVK